MAISGDFKPQHHMMKEIEDVQKSTIMNCAMIDQLEDADYYFTLVGNLPTGEKTLDLHKPAHLAAISAHEKIMALNGRIGELEKVVDELSGYMSAQKMSAESVKIMSEGGMVKGNVEDLKNEQPKGKISTILGYEIKQEIRDTPAKIGDTWKSFTHGPKILQIGFTSSDSFHIGEDVRHDGFIMYVVAVHPDRGGGPYFKYFAVLANDHDRFISKYQRM